MNPIRVLLVEDHTVVREGFRLLLAAEADLDLVGEAQSGRQAVTLAAKLRPDVVVMDIAMPHLNGLEAARKIRRSMPGIRVLMLSAHGDDAYVDQAVAVGAVGYLLKQTSAHTLAEAIRAVHRGETFFSPSLAERLRHRSPAAGVRKRKRGAPAVRLSPREMEVLQLIAEGSPNKAIAADLGISIKTVEKHRDQVMRKLEIHDTAGLTRYAIATGVIESSVQLTIL